MSLGIQILIFDARVKWDYSLFAFLFYFHKFYLQFLLFVIVLHHQLFFGNSSGKKKSLIYRLKIVKMELCRRSFDYFFFLNCQSTFEWHSLCQMLLISSEKLIFLCFLCTLALKLQLQNISYSLQSQLYTMI